MKYIKYFDFSCVDKSSSKNHLVKIVSVNGKKFRLTRVLVVSIDKVVAKISN